MSDWMDKVPGSRVSEGGVYPLPGTYTVEILKVKAGKTREGVPNFIVECKVLKSTVKERPVGSTFDWYVNMNHEPSPGNVKQFIMALTGAPESEITKEAILFIVGTDQPLKGKIADMIATNITTKVKKQTFTKCTWFPPGAADASKVE